MKKLLTTLALLLVIIFASALKKTTPGDLTPKRKITGKQNVTKGYERAKMDVYITNTEGLGEILNFKSSVNIFRVEILYIGKTDPAQNSIYKSGVKDGFFYLESGAYNSGLQKGCTLNFFTSNSLRNNNPTWTFTVGPKEIL